MGYASWMSSQSRQKTNVPLVIFATILVVGGVALVAYVASQSKTLAPTILVPESTSQTPTSSRPTLLVVDATGARIVSDGKERKLVWPADVKLLGQPLSTLTGRAVGDGSSVVLDPEFKIADKKFFRSPDGRHELLAAKARSDGTGTVDVRYGNDSQSIVTRLSNGTAVRSVIPVGWWNNETAAVTGMVTSSRALFAVPIVGSVTRVAYLSDTYERLTLDHGAAYYVTVTPGEGLEAIDSPPSSMIRVQRNGTVETLATEPNLLIDRLIVNEVGVVAYHAYSEAESKTIIRRSDGQVVQGKGDPLLILEDEQVLSRQDLGNLVGNESAVFLLPRANLDEIFGTK